MCTPPPGGAACRSSGSALHSAAAKQTCKIFQLAHLSMSALHIQKARHAKPFGYYDRATLRGRTPFTMLYALRRAAGATENIRTGPFARR